MSRALALVLLCGLMLSLVAAIRYLTGRSICVGGTRVPQATTLALRIRAPRADNTPRP
jgi:hypothetical protein